MTVARPAWIWWVLIVPSMSWLGVLASSASITTAWRAATRLPLGQPVYQWILGVALFLHVAEGAYAWRRASASAEAPRRVGWALQTLVLGYPSLRLLLERTPAAP